MKTSFYEVFLRCCDCLLVEEPNRQNDDCNAYKAEACFYHRSADDVSIVAIFRNQAERIVGDVDDDARNQTPGSVTHPCHDDSHDDGSWNLCRVEMDEAEHDAGGDDSVPGADVPSQHLSHRYSTEEVFFGYRSNDAEYQDSNRIMCHVNKILLHVIRQIHESF